jgi:hypothetical protein
METPTKQPDSQVKELRNGRLAMLAFSGATGPFRGIKHGWETPMKNGHFNEQNICKWGGIFQHV